MITKYVHLIACGLVAVIYHALPAIAAEETEAVKMTVPQEVSVVCDSFIKGEDAPPGNKITLSMVATLGTRQNPANKAWELVITLRARMIAAALEGAYKGEAVTVIKTFPLTVKQVALQDGYPTTHNFSWTEEFADKPKQFGWSHPGFDLQKEPRKLIGTIFYDGPTTKKLRVLLNTQLPLLQVTLLK